MSIWLANLGAVITAILGALALVRPGMSAAMVGLAPRGALGLAEIRASLGGLFLALGLACLLTQHPIIFTVAGIAWLGAAAGRLVSIPLDGGWQRENAGGLAVEAGTGLLLLAGGPVLS